MLSLGFSAGALLAEGRVLVPFWRGLEPAGFLGWYRAHASLLLRFFGPLEALAAVLPLLAAGLAAWQEARAAGWLLASALCSLGVLACFPIYFKAVNARFADGSIPLDEVTAELGRWASWHRARTALAVAAFACGSFALLRMG